MKKKNEEEWLVRCIAYIRQAVCMAAAYSNFIIVSFICRLWSFITNIIITKIYSSERVAAIRVVNQFIDYQFLVNFIDYFNYQFN